MKILNTKKGFVTHPVMLFVIGIVLGLVLVYLWINYLTMANPFC